MLPPSFRRPTGVALVLSFVLSAGVFGVWLSAHAGDPSFLHACVNPASGELKIVGPDDSCRPGWTAQAWPATAPLAPVVHYAEQTADLTTTGVSNWTDLPGAQVTFTTAANAILDLSANGAVTVDGGSPWVRCALRFVVDGVPSSNGPYRDLFGDMLTSPARNEGGGAEWSSFSLIRRVLIEAGSHTVGVQMARGYTTASSSNNCRIDGQDYSAVRLQVAVR